MLNAFCVDTEEWFHVCGVKTPYSDPATWQDAPSHVVRNTDVLLKFLDDAGVRGTFLCLGWVAEQHPSLIRRLAGAGHEIGCHGYLHQLVYTMTPDEFETDLQRSLAILRDLSGQPVSVYRAPSFSITNECFWAYPILSRNGVEVDVSLVPARRDNGGVDGLHRDPFLLKTSDGQVKCFPVSVMTLLGRAIPFSGGGYLRLLPQSVINAGFRQNHRQKRVGMCYIHPREIDPDQPRLPLPRIKSFKYYVNLRTTQRKLRHLLQRFRFSTVADVVATVEQWPEYTLSSAKIDN
ncbi:MAG: polysaccharide deacetylase family protein [Fuerstiella sp.]|nr:polysaccharide deacetylase family protein [Fuerstiella sp.]